MDITIQKALLTPQLEEELIALSAQWEEEDCCYGFKTNTSDDFKGLDIFLASAGDTLVGYLLCRTYTQKEYICTVPTGSQCLEIEELYIRPEYRSQGIGRALYTAAADSCGDAVEYVTLGTANKNYKAILHFYVEELGMTFWSARLFQKRKN